MKCELCNREINVAVEEPEKIPVNTDGVMDWRHAFGGRKVMGCPMCYDLYMETLEATA